MRSVASEASQPQARKVTLCSLTCPTKPAHARDVVRIAEQSCVDSPVLYGAVLRDQHLCTGPKKVQHAATRSSCCNTAHRVATRHKHVVPHDAHAVLHGFFAISRCAQRTLFEPPAALDCEISLAVAADCNAQQAHSFVRCNLPFGAQCALEYCGRVGGCTSCAPRVADGCATVCYSVRVCAV